MPEAVRLLAWARELATPMGGNEPAPAPAAPATASCAELTPADALRALAIKGFADAEGAAAALLCTPAEAGALLGKLAADRLAELASGLFQLTPDGKSLAMDLIAADSRAWGPANAGIALDAFLALDRRVKETVTAYQLRDAGGVQALNDHLDADYDARVLAQLGDLHREVEAWLRPLLGPLPRLAMYGRRLARAAAAVGAGDARYLGSPRVDSYHSVWFELHEDLILLAGRTRADEAAAGRA
jgi:pyruvate,orthophosphate dikinase